VSYVALVLLLVSRLDSRGDFGGRSSNGDFSLYDVVFFAGVIFHLSVGCGHEMGVGERDLPRTVEGHLAVEPRDQDRFVGLDETNGAQLPDSVVSAWVDVRLSCEDVSEPILHDCTVGVESIHSEGDTGGDVVSVDLVGVVGRHCTIALKSNGSIDGESFGESLASEMSQSIWVSAKHWHTILQHVAEYFP